MDHDPGMKQEHMKETYMLMAWHAVFDPYNPRMTVL